MSDDKILYLQKTSNKRADISSEQAQHVLSTLKNFVEAFEKGLVMQIGISLDYIDTENDGTERRMTQYCWFSEKNSNPQLLTGVTAELKHSILQSQLKENENDS